MSQSDPFAQFKVTQREGWAHFAAVEFLTSPPASKLVNFAGVESGQKVLDVGCGTGVVAITAARKGARVKGIDLSPVLIEKAKWNAHLSGTDIDFVDGDAEALPFKNKEFDVVLSQFGHMFAPRPDVAISEMLRVLKPGGIIAFSTWPPEMYTGKMFALTAKYLPLPGGVAAPSLWGDPQVIRDRLGEEVKDLFFERDLITSPALSPQHFRHFMETTVGPLTKLQETSKDEPIKLNEFRAEFEHLISQFFENNTVRQHFIMSRATKC